MITILCMDTLCCVSCRDVLDIRSQSAQWLCIVSRCSPSSFSVSKSREQWVQSCAYATGEACTSANQHYFAALMRINGCLTEIKDGYTIRTVLEGLDSVLPIPVLGSQTMRCYIVYSSYCCTRTEELEKLEKAEMRGKIRCLTRSNHLCVSSLDSRPTATTAASSLIGIVNNPSCRSVLNQCASDLSAR
ncbi:hypothetical protein VTK73DRAFT_6559 [Phialemonium thermophilum]|uniref:Uncharacterized protein n=1 Tax=Phialemonium thermophilum TaxID=223376 RepID=A0ABR3XWT0_9PEZI